MGAQINKSIKQLTTAKNLLNVILWYLLVFSVSATFTFLLPDKGIMIPIMQIVFWAFLLVLPFAIATLVFNSRVFVQMAKSDPSLRSAAQVASSVTLGAGAYILVYIIWSSKWNELALGLDHNMVILLQASPVLAGLIILASHVFVTKHSLARLKSTSVA
jgi:hypothetical protein